MKMVKRLLALSLVMCFMLSTVIMVGASSVSQAQAWTNLVNNLKSGKYPTANNATVEGASNWINLDTKTNTYKMSSGGFYTYSEMFSSNAGEIINASRFEQLTASSKQEFLKDMLDIAYAWAAVTEQSPANGEGITDETVNQLLLSLQNTAGMGSTVLSTLLKDYKPDFVAANRLISPMQGAINTAIGVVALFTFALLGLSIALDLAYIGIPAFQMVCDDGGNGGNGGEGGKGKSGVGGIISKEAHKAVEQANGTGGGTSDNRTAIGIYFGIRWKILVVLSIALVLFVNGLIYPFIGRFIDLFTGVLGF